MKVAVVTGTRAEFGIWQPVLRAIASSKRMELQLIVTGMHLQREFGFTVRDVEAFGVPIARRVPMYQPAESSADALGRATAGLGRAYRELRTNLVLVLGDRLEMLAAAAAAVACGLPIGHLHGGETAPGTWDEQIRHAVTKMAHLHFCATKRAAARVRQMGEPAERVHVTGAPAIDTALTFVEEFGMGEGEQSAVVLLHPSSPDERLEERRAAMMVKTLRAVGLQFGVIGPNNDPGHRGILRAYARSGIEIEMSLTQRAFWERLAGASTLVGNSSSGIIEAATFGVPVVNIGERQKGRERNANVLDAPWDENAIEETLRRTMEDTAFLRRVARRRNLYGDGHAAERIVAILEGMGGPPPVTKAFSEK